MSVRARLGAHGPRGARVGVRECARVRGWVRIGARWCAWVRGWARVRANSYEQGRIEISENELKITGFWVYGRDAPRVPRYRSDRLTGLFRLGKA